MRVLRATLFHSDTKIVFRQDILVLERGDGSDE